MTFIKQGGWSVGLRIRSALLLLVVLATAQSALAARLTDKHTYYPEEFYSELETGLRDGGLRDKLFAILSEGHVSTSGSDRLVKNCAETSACREHKALGYTGARRALFGELHLIRVNGQYAIKDLYCERVFTESEFRGDKPGPGQIPDHTLLNAEHTWPQSRFSARFKKDLQKSDLHILFPVFSHANSARGNIPFSDVVTEVSSPCTKSRRGFTSRGQNVAFFEAPATHKGNVARAIFYFSVRYKLAVDPEEEDSLRQWHRQDPVDAAERARNDAIHTKQHVRNPFIDHPELVELISNF